MKVRYFAWMKDHTGTSADELSVPDDVNTVGELAAYLRTLSEGHGTALRNLETVRVAVNQRYARLDTAIQDSDEVAFFPPVTGG